MTCKRPRNSKWDSHPVGNLWPRLRGMQTPLTLFSSFKYCLLAINLAKKGPFSSVNRRVCVLEPLIDFHPFFVAYPKCNFAATIARLNRSTNDPIINNRLVSRSRQILDRSRVYRFNHGGESSQSKQYAPLTIAPVAQTAEICFFFPRKVAATKRRWPRFCCRCRRTELGRRCRSLRERRHCPPPAMA